MRLSRIPETLVSKIIFYLLVLKQSHFRDFLFSLKVFVCSWAGWFSRAAGASWRGAACCPSSGECPLQGAVFLSHWCSRYVGPGSTVSPGMGTRVRAKLGPEGCLPGWALPAPAAPTPSWPSRPFQLVLGLHAPSPPQSRPLSSLYLPTLLLQKCPPRGVSTLTRKLKTPSRA